MKRGGGLIMFCLIYKNKGGEFLGFLICGGVRVYISVFYCFLVSLVFLGLN